jgi:hypothetical protein
LIEDFLKMNTNPDILILLEAGRSSKGHSWTEMAFLIEIGLGLMYQGINQTTIQRINPSFVLSINSYIFFS